MLVLVFVGTLAVVPALGWIVHQLRPGFFGRDPGAVFTAYCLGALIGWAGMAILR